MASGIGDRFQQETKYHREQPLHHGRPAWPNGLAPSKAYPDAPVVLLDPPHVEGGMPLWEAIRQRRSARDFAGVPIARNQLAQLLWAAQGITHVRGSLALRAAPSVGTSYPIETYVIVHAVADLAPGIYHYAVAQHALEQLRAGDLRTSLAEAAVAQTIAREANAVLVWTAVFARAQWKYGQRAYRHVYLDAGHIAQNAALSAVALGLGACPLAVFYDDEVNRLLAVDGTQESAIYMLAVGQITE